MQGMVMFKLTRKNTDAFPKDSQVITVLGSYLYVHEEGNVVVGESEMCWMLQSSSFCCLSDS